MNGPQGRIASYYQNNSQYLYYYLTDHLGSTRVVMRGYATEPPATGYVMAGYYTYHPFGSLNESWTNYNTKFKFTGKERDDHSTFQFDYFGARYYDSRTGLFLTADKAEQFMSAYLYGGNNPVMGVDPDGNLAWFVPILIGAALNTVANIQYIHDAADFASFLGIGALGGALAMVGNPGAWCGMQNVLYGAVEGGLTGGLNATAQGKNFFKDGFLTGAGIGAGFGMITSEQFKNFTRGKGWQSHQGVLDNFVEQLPDDFIGPPNLDYQGALDYFGFEGEYNPKMVDKLRELRNEPLAQAYTKTDGSIYYHTDAFRDYQHLKAINLRESVHATDFSKMSNLKSVDADLARSMEIRAYTKQYQNYGLYRGGPDGYTGLEGLHNAHIVVTPSVSYNSWDGKAWWHFIYRAPRRFGTF